jgi:hypothetical protein
MMPELVPTLRIAFLIAAILAALAIGYAGHAASMPVMVSALPALASVPLGSS